MARPTSLLLLPALLGLAAAQSNLTDCLSSLSSTLLLPSSPSYDAKSTAYNLRLHPSPLALVYPSSAEDIASAVRCAAEADVPVIARSGGHSYAAYGLGGADEEALVISLDSLKKIEVDENGKATIETGNRLGDVIQGIWDEGERALPTGTCPYVGIGGHAAFGGYGPFSRKAGLLLDRISGAKVVLANGTITSVSETEQPDLFWALRGAAPSFGIVTSWIFDTLPAPNNTVGFTLNYWGRPKEDLVSAFDAFQQFFAGNPPDELYIVLVLGPDGSGRISFQLQGNYFGSEDDFRATTQPLLDALPEGYDLQVNNYGWIDGVEATSGSLDTSGPAPNDTFYAKSLFIDEPLSSDALDSYFTYLFEEGANSDLGWYAMSDAYNGAISAVPSNATAFPHRSALLSFQLYASSPTYSPPYPSDEGFAFVDGLLGSITSEPKAAYINYVDPRLEQAQWEEQYFGGNYERLRQIKREVDPGNVFRWQQSVRLAE